MITIFALLIVFQIKHFIADYPLQNSYMLGKFKDKEWILPLSCHCGIHALLTFLIVLYFGFKIAIICSIIDFILHFVMDRIKASPKMLGKFQSISKGEYKGLSESKILCEHAIRLLPSLERQDGADEAFRRLEEINERFKSNVYFWWSLGLDQMVHHLTHYLIIFILVI